MEKQTGNDRLKHQLYELKLEIFEDMLKNQPPVTMADINQHKIWKDDTILFYTKYPSMTHQFDSPDRKIYQMLKMSVDAPDNDNKIGMRVCNHKVAEFKQYCKLNGYDVPVVDKCNDKMPRAYIPYL